MTKLINFLIKNGHFQYKEAKINSNSQIVKGKIRKYQILDTKTKPRIVKTANTKPANYSLTVVSTIVASFPE